MAKSVRDAMTTNPSTIDADQDVAAAAKLMKEQDVGVAPIVEGGQLFGVLTDRDITVKVVAEGKDPQSTKVRDIASKDVITIDPQQDLDEALRMMAQHQVRRLPVVEEDGKIVGILAQADVALQAEEAKTGEVVEEISK
jgi:CBS domain-containing protein